MSTPMSVIIPNALAEPTIVARVSKDAEMRFTPSGSKVTNFDVAVSRRYQKDNEWCEQTAFISVAVWGDAAERIASLKKGNVVSITFSLADLSTRAYTKQSGELGANLEIKRAQVSRMAWPQGENGNGASAEAETPVAVGPGASEDEFPF